MMNNNFKNMQDIAIKIRKLLNNKIFNYFSLSDSTINGQCILIDLRASQNKECYNVILKDINNKKEIKHSCTDIKNIFILN